MRNPKPSFEWDAEKNQSNQDKHGVLFALAQFAFADSDRVILEDLEYSEDEQRFFCLGKVAEGILTVRFYPKRRDNSYFWSWLLAKRKKNL